MARLRHIAVCVKDLDKAARFYEEVFDLQAGRARGPRDRLGDLYERWRDQPRAAQFHGLRGQLDLKDAASFVGAHHFGFQVDDLAETQKRIEEAGGKFFFDLATSGTAISSASSRTLTG